MYTFESAHPYRSLPPLPDLGHLRDEAKSLKRLGASGDPGALAFLDFHRGKTPNAGKLADAQFALARSYGFKSWARLKAFVESQSRSPAERGVLLLQSLFTDNHSLLQETQHTRHGADPNHLDWALFRNRGLRIIELLVEHGAGLNRTAEDYWLLKRIQGLTPVQVAERGGIDAALAYLLAKGATDNRTPKDMS